MKTTGVAVVVVALFFQAFVLYSAVLRSKDMAFVGALSTTILLIAAYRAFFRSKPGAAAEKVTEEGMRRRVIVTALTAGLIGGSLGYAIHDRETPLTPQERLRRARGLPRIPD